MMIFVAGCAQVPRIQVIQTECIWAKQFHWTSEQADQLIDCCPALARGLLTHNALMKEFCE